MTQKQRGLVFLENLEVGAEGQRIVVLGNGNIEPQFQPGADPSGSQIRPFAPQCLGYRIELKNYRIPVTDTGGVGGGFFGLALAFPEAVPYFIIGGVYLFQITGVGPDIDENAPSIVLALGTVQKTGGGTIPPFDLLSKLVAAPVDLAVTSGVSPAVAEQTALAAAWIDTTNDTGVWLNCFVPDASISANSYIDVSLNGFLSIYPAGGFSFVP